MRSKSSSYVGLTTAALIVWSGCQNSSKTDHESNTRLEHELIRLYERQPDDYKGDEVLAVAAAYARQEKFEAALRVYRRFTLETPQDSRGWLGSGSAYLMLKRYDDAIASFEKADSLGNTDGLRMLASAYGCKKDWSRIKAQAPRLLDYASATGETDDERFEVVGLLILASACSEPKDMELFNQCLALLPKETKEWRKDVENAAVAMLEATNDQLRLEACRRGSNPGR